MDCNQAREHLERISLDVADQADPEYSAAAAHAQSCNSCRRQLEDIAAQDLAIGEIVRDVPLPSGLETRLLQAVEREVASTSPLPAERQSSPTSRRRFFTRRLPLAMACVAFAAAGFWVWQLNSKTELDDLIALSVKSISAEADGLLFQGQYDPLDQFPPLRFPSDIELQDFRRLSGTDRSCEAAVLRFSFVDRQNRRILGALVMAPVESIVQPPTASSMAGAVVEYRENGVHSKSWQAGGFVYVCVIDGGEDSLLELQHGSGQDWL